MSSVDMRDEHNRIVVLDFACPLVDTLHLAAPAGDQPLILKVYPAVIRQTLDDGLADDWPVLYTPCPQRRIMRCLDQQVMMHVRHAGMVQHGEAKLRLGI